MVTARRGAPATRAPAPGTARLPTVVGLLSSGAPDRAGGRTTGRAPPEGPAATPAQHGRRVRVGGRDTGTRDVVDQRADAGRPGPDARAPGLDQPGGRLIGAGPEPELPTAGRVVGRFVLANLVAVVLLMAGSVWASGAAAKAEAIADARHSTDQLAMLLVEPALDERLAAGDPAGVRAMDDVLLPRLAAAEVQRVKIWSADQQILYSDEPRLIGQSFELEDEEQEALRGRPHPGRAQRPQPAREPLRTVGRRAPRGLPRDPDPGGATDAPGDVLLLPGRDRPAGGHLVPVRRDLGVRAAGPARHAAAARPPDGDPVARRRTGTGTAARPRPERLRRGAAPDRRQPARRDRPGRVGLRPARRRGGRPAPRQGAQRELPTPSPTTSGRPPRPSATRLGRCGRCSSRSTLPIWNARGCPPRSATSPPDCAPAGSRPGSASRTTSTSRWRRRACCSAPPRRCC